MEQDYTAIIAEQANKVFEIMKSRVSDEDLKKIKKAFELAHEAHMPQRRKSGEPYILHPISVALIAADELHLDANSVCAAFLHDVVEDTDYTIEDIERMFGNEVAFLVNTVTKKKKKEYHITKQVDNFQQLLGSLESDLRALMIKIADRLHNMRTLSSMRLDKQMKIAGETDYFYAPLANRLGLFDVKTDLENLSFKYRCTLEYDDIERDLQQDMANDHDRLKQFTSEIENILKANGVADAKAVVYYRKPFSLWRRMKATNKDFKHIENRYYVRVTFKNCPKGLTEKTTCLKIYSHLTDVFKEKPQSFNNLIDQAKENSYQCLKMMLLSDEGIWEEVQICSDRMVEVSKLGCLAEVGRGNISDWICRFKSILKDIAEKNEEVDYIEDVATSLYYDDVMVFTTDGKGIIMPKGATAIDFAFEILDNEAYHAKYARINGKLCSLKTELNRGDCIEIGIDNENKTVKDDWIDHTVTYKAKDCLRQYLSSLKKPGVHRCECCQPLPGGDLIGFVGKDGGITIHRRSCPEIVRLATEHGDSIIKAEFPESPDAHYPITIHIKAIDRYHLLIDLIDNITNKLKLSIDSLTTETKDEIVNCSITFFVHSVRELVSSMEYLYTIDGVDEVYMEGGAH